MDSLHLSYDLTPLSLQRLNEWDGAIQAEPGLQPMRWHVYLERYLRSATVSASWLTRSGRTRAASYSRGPRMEAIQLRAPDIVDRYVRGLTLGLDAA
jgi:hypothetical protein